jgi:hypothetical protein
VKDHSVFARAFLDVLEANNMPIEGYRVFRALDGKVLRFAQQQNFDQAPLYAAMQQAWPRGGRLHFRADHSGFQRELGTLKVCGNRIRNVATGVSSRAQQDTFGRTDAAQQATELLDRL